MTKKIETLAEPSPFPFMSLATLALLTEKILAIPGVKTATLERETPPASS